MARQAYKEDQSIHSMTTRQLRQYIADQADDAEKRLKTINRNDTSKAFREAADAITRASGKPIRSTSYLSKAEMRELAYKYRDFKSLDIYSGYSKSIDWQENKQRYKTFIQNRIDAGDTYWSKYKTEKGNISKKGYEDYKNYINFLKTVNDVKSEYGYKQIKGHAINYVSDPRKSKEISLILTKVYEESTGKNSKSLTQSQLIDKANKRIEEYLKAEKAKEIAEANNKLAEASKKAKQAKKPQSKAPNIPKVKTKGGKPTKNKVQTKTAGKMREYGKVRRTGR